MSTETDDIHTHSDSDDYTGSAADTGSDGYSDTDTETDAEIGNENETENETETHALTGTGIGGGTETDVPWSTDEADAAQRRLVAETSPVQTEEDDETDEADGEIINGELAEGNTAGGETTYGERLDENEAGNEHEAEAEPEYVNEAEPEADEDVDTVFPAYDQVVSQDPVHQSTVSVEPQVGMQPLLTDEVESELLSRWTAIQASFVEDPRQSVRAADSLIQEIAAALASALQDRRSDLAAQWREDEGDTEQLRQTLRQYRAFVGVILPK